MVAFTLVVLSAVNVSASANRIIILSQGSECNYCDQQYEAFVRLEAVLTKYGVKVVFVSPTPVNAEATWHNKGNVVEVIHDDDERRRLAVLVGAPMNLQHGIFILADNGSVVWNDTGPGPFQDVAVAVGEALKPELAVEIQLNDTPDTTDDYLTWAPMPARIRLVRQASQTGSVTLIITNDVEKPGPERPLGGSFAFSSTIFPGQTATQPSLSLTLPTDGGWVPFFVAGSFPRASSADKDAIMEVHLETDNGPVLGRHSAMVRVRKNVDSLTETERDAYLRALHDVHIGKNTYELFAQMHDLAAKGKEDYFPPLPDGSPNPNYWPDQAHRGSAFLAWHRAFLLLLERELQKLNPAVTIPYWKQNVVTKAMEARFLVQIVGQMAHSRRK